MSATMRVDLLAAGIYERAVVAAAEWNSFDLSEEQLKEAAVGSWNAAAVFIAEASRRDPLTGERNHSDLPADDGEGER
jgi:hypothetical protein